MTTGTSRTIPPADFIFKIQSFSSLLSRKTKKVESRIFQSGGYKWRLCLSRGSEKENGGDHISIYLSIVDTHRLPSGWEVLVNLKLFLFNETKNEYLSIPDVDGEVWRFHCLKTEWGYDKLLPLSTFRDPTNGFVVDDSCSFGAEIYVIKPNNATFECKDLSKPTVTEKPNENVFTWKIQDFTKVKRTTRLYSPEFVIQGRKWRLELYPNRHGLSLIFGKGFSIILTLVDPKSLGSYNLKAQYSLRMRDQVSGESKERELVHTFSPSDGSVGLYDFLSLKELENSQKSYLLDNTLVLEVEIRKLHKWERDDVPKYIMFGGSGFMLVYTWFFWNILRK